MSGARYKTIRAVVETSNELEKKILNYAKKEGIRMPRARRQLAEKGLAIVETRKYKLKEESTKDVQDV